MGLVERKQPERRTGPAPSARPRPFGAVRSFAVPTTMTEFTPRFEGPCLASLPRRTGGCDDSVGTPSTGARQAPSPRRLPGVLPPLRSRRRGLLLGRGQQRLPPCQNWNDTPSLPQKAPGLTTASPDGSCSGPTSGADKGPGLLDHGPLGSGVAEGEVDRPGGVVVRLVVGDTQGCRP